MAQMTWRTSDDLLERVRRQAREHGRSLNDWVTVVLSAASDPSLAGDEAQRVRERLAAAGLLDPVTPTAGRRPDAADLARARSAAGQGTALSQMVSEGRR
jgi:plasmid stability protein